MCIAAGALKSDGSRCMSPCEDACRDEYGCCKDVPAAPDAASACPNGYSLNPFTHLCASNPTFGQPAPAPKPPSCPSVCVYGCDDYGNCNDPPAPHDPVNPGVPHGVDATTCPDGTNYLFTAYEAFVGCKKGYHKEQTAFTSQCVCDASPGAVNGSGTAAGSSVQGSALDPLASLGQAVTYIPYLILGGVLIAALGVFGGKK